MPPGARVSPSFFHLQPNVRVQVLVQELLLFEVAAGLESDSLGELVVSDRVLCALENGSEIYVGHPDGRPVVHLVFGRLDSRLFVCRPYSGLHDAYPFLFPCLCPYPCLGLVLVLFRGPCHGRVGRRRTAICL